MNEHACHEQKNPLVTSAGGQVILSAHGAGIVASLYFMHTSKSKHITNPHSGDHRRTKLPNVLSSMRRADVSLPPG